MDRAEERLDALRVLFDHLLRREVAGIRHFAGFKPDVGYDIALASLLKFGRGRLEQRHIIAFAALERARHQVELDRVDDRAVFAVDQTVLRHDPPERHDRHAALSAADDGLPFQLIPRRCSAIRSVLY